MHRERQYLVCYIFAISRVMIVPVVGIVICSCGLGVLASGISKKVFVAFINKGERSCEIGCLCRVLGLPALQMLSVL